MCLKIVVDRLLSWCHIICGRGYQTVILIEILITLFVLNFQKQSEKNRNNVSGENLERR